MYTNIKKLILFVGLSTAIHAETNNHYLGLGGSLTQTNTATIDKEYMGDITLKYGYKLINRLNLELRGSFYAFGGKALYHPSSFGLYFKPYYNIGDSFNMYALLGYTRNTLSKQDTTQKHAVTIQDDFSYGAGVEYKLNTHLYGYVDYLNYIDKTYHDDKNTYTMNISSLSLGIVYKFGKKETKKPLETTGLFYPKPKVTKTPIKIYKKPTFVEFQVFDDFADKGLENTNKTYPNKRSK